MNLPKKGKVKVVFLNTDGAAGKQPIFAQLNGNSILIPRNEEGVIDVDWLRGVFDNAVVTEYENGPDGRGITTPRSVPRYPYQVLGVVSDEDAGEIGTAKSSTKGARKTATGDGSEGTPAQAAGPVENEPAAGSAA